jgi:monofunctional glycosyltransferase
MADAKRRNARHVALGTAALGLFWLLGVWPPPVWWRTHWPRETAMMRAARSREARTPAPADSSFPPPQVHPVPETHFSPLLERLVIIGEDSRFRTHHGIDPDEIRDALGVGQGQGVWSALGAAWRHRDRLRGASTITQQLAKNLYLSSSRSPWRKLKEAVTALRLELTLPKERILELYLNVAEWGPGIWGADAASRAYFGAPPIDLDEEEAAELAATLPHPLSSNPAWHPDRMLARRALILAHYHGAAPAVPREEEEDSVMAGLPGVVQPHDSLDSLPAEDSLPSGDSASPEPPAPGDTAPSTPKPAKPPPSAPRS